MRGTVRIYCLRNLTSTRTGLERKLKLHGNTTRGPSRNYDWKPEGPLDYSVPNVIFSKTVAQLTRLPSLLLCHAFVLPPLSDLYFISARCSIIVFVHIIRVLSICVIHKHSIRISKSDNRVKLLLLDIAIQASLSHPRYSFLSLTCSLFSAPYSPVSLLGCCDRTRMEYTTRREDEPKSEKRNSARVDVVSNDTGGFEIVLTPDTPTLIINQ